MSTSSNRIVSCGHRAWTTYYYRTTWNMLAMALHQVIKNWTEWNARGTQVTFLLCHFSIFTSTSVRFVSKRKIVGDVSVERSNIHHCGDSSHGFRHTILQMRRRTRTEFVFICKWMIIGSHAVHSAHKVSRPNESLLFSNGMREFRAHFSTC